MIITLDIKAIELAEKVALRRRNSAVELNRPPGNNAPTEWHAALKIDRLGCRCEVAGARFLRPIIWHAHARRVRGLPDLGEFVDVKGIDESYKNLMVQLDDPNEWAYFLVYQINHEDFEMKGWLWGYEAKQERFKKDPKGNRPAFFVPPPYRDPEDLRKLIHESRRTS